MPHAHETPAYVTGLCKRLLACETKDELDRVFDQPGIEQVLNGYPDDPSDAIVMYALNIARIEEDTPGLPAYALDDKLCGRAAARLAMVYLARIGFLSHFEETSDRFAWRTNPMHPLVATVDRLKEKNYALWVVAQEAWTNAGPGPVTLFS